MALSGLARKTAKPAGGVARVELIAAADFKGVAYDRVQGYFTSVETTAPFVTWAFREDGASYAEKCSAGDGRHTVGHILKMELPGGPETRRVVEELSEAAAGGLIAIVTTREGERLLAGYSTRFGAVYPLKLESAESAGGKSPADLPVETVILSSIDADRSLPLK